MYHKWVHKRCTGIKGRLTAVVDFICKTCVSPLVAVPNLLREKIVIGTDEFESVVDFCYLGDALGQAGGCAEAVTARIRSAWKSFHGLLPLLTQPWH